MCTYIQPGLSTNIGIHPEPLRQWFAIHTRAKHEKKVASELQLKGVTAFVPTVPQVRQWSDRRKVLDSALFSCYAFVQTTPSPEVHYTVLEIPGVLRWIGFGGTPCVIPDAQIEAVRRLVQTRTGCAWYPFLITGQRVRIRGGCLEGLECILVSKPNDRKLVVSVEPIQRSICIPAEGYTIESV
jgi:transcription antitermination factor NusG